MKPKEQKTNSDQLVVSGSADRTLYYNFCMGIPDKNGTACKVNDEGNLEGLWKEKGLQFNTDEEAEQYASEKNYPYFERVYMKNGERWKQPFMSE